MERAQTKAVGGQKNEEGVWSEWKMAVPGKNAVQRDFRKVILDLRGEVETGHFMCGCVGN